MVSARIAGRFRGGAGRAGRRRRERVDGVDRGAETPPPPAAVRERRRLLLSLGLGTALVAVVFGVVAFGYYREFYRPPRVWAGSVNNVEFTMGDLVQRIRVLQGVNRYQGGQVNLGIVPFEYLQGLVNAEILRQAAPDLGIQPPPEAVDAAVRAQFAPTLAPGQEADPGQLEQEFRNSYQIFLTATGLSDGDFRVITEENLTLGALTQLLSQQIESPQPQVEVQWIRLPLDDSLSEATGLQPEEVASRLAVEEFAAVAQEVSRTGGYADASGYVGWVPRGAFPQLDPLLFGDPERNAEPLTPGEISRPVFTQDEQSAAFIVQLLAAPQERELSDAMRRRLNFQGVEDWQNARLQEGSENGTVRMNFNSRLYEWVADQVAVTAPRIAPRQQNPAGPPGLGGG